MTAVPSMNVSLKILSAGMLSLLLAGCAGQLAPVGGPADTTPPAIIETYPANNATRFAENRVTLAFSEYVDKGSVEQSVFISPNVGSLKFDWSGKDVEISFSKKLRENTTYVINIGTDVKDINAGNRMASAHTLAFSTGDSIDRCAIEGRVFAEKADDAVGVMIFAYLLDGGNADTLNPVHVYPDFVTQTGKGGTFSLSHLPAGAFRLLAVQDDYHNLLYDPETDKYGVSFGDFTLTARETLQTRVWIKMAVEDTTGPRLVKAEAVDQRHTLVEFSEELDTASVRAGAFTVRDTITGAFVAVRSVFPSAKGVTTLLLEHEPARDSAGYAVIVSGVRDKNGIVVSRLADRLGFSGTGVRDTLPPMVAVPPVSDSGKNMPLLPHLRILLSKPVQNIAESITARLWRNDSIRVALTCVRRNDAEVELTPKNELFSKTWYTLRVNLRDCVDAGGLTGKDTVLVYRFQTIDAELFSGIEGTVTDETGSGDGGTFHVFARAVGGSQKPVEAVVDATGTFQFPRLVEGTYALDAFRDRNGNGVFDPGRPFPFVPSERFAVHPDTLKLRARWPLDGVRIRFR